MELPTKESIKMTKWTDLAHIVGQMAGNIVLSGRKVRSMAKEHSS